MLVSRASLPVGELSHLSREAVAVHAAPESFNNYLPLQLQVLLPDWALLLADFLFASASSPLWSLSLLASLTTTRPLPLGWERLLPLASA